MNCSHYELRIYDKENKEIGFCWVYSFEEAYFNIDNFREKFPDEAVKFVIQYPDKDVYEGEKDNGQCE